MYYYIKEDGKPLNYVIWSSNAEFTKEIKGEQDIFEFSLNRSNKVLINIDYSNAEDIEKNIYFWGVGKDLRSNIYKLIEENSYSKTYEVSLSPNDDIYIMENDNLREYGIFEEDNLLDEKESFRYYKKFNLEDNKNEYKFQVKKVEPEISSSIKWEDERKLKLKFDGKNRREFFPEKQEYRNQEWSYFIIFAEKLNENFKVSEEYENDSKWLIVNEDEIINTKFENKDWLYGEEDYYKKLMSDLEANQNIPEYIFATFFDHYPLYTGNGGSYGEIYLKDEKRYIYVKDKNILYCVTDKNDINESINLEYRNDEDDINNRKFDFNSSATYFYRRYFGSTAYNDLEYMNIPMNKKEIEYKTQEKTKIVVNKVLENEENDKYYIGLFENDKDEVTDKIYDLEIEDRVGSITIDIADFDKSNKYYIYEVDKTGKKIVEDNIKYSKNRVLENKNIVNRYNILSNKDVVSLVLTTAKLEEDIRVIQNLNGEEKNYIDNSLLCEKVNEDTVTIAPIDFHMVKYETKHQGNLDGKTKEAVKHGNKPVNVPNVIANDGYEFDKWIVIKNGVEIEVVPSEYIILEDTTFIAKYKDIKVSENKDTSDINVWLYIGIAIISIIVICIIVLVLNIKNKNKKTK